MDKSEPSSPLKGLSSPLGVSRYGRTRKPKISADFCHIDDALGGEEVSVIVSKSPANSPKQADSTAQKKIKSSPDKKIKKPKPEVETWNELDIKREIEVSEDIKNEGLKVLNDVFESAPIDDVLKIIGATKPSDVSVTSIKKRSPQQLRTYVNKKKIVAPQSRVIESFGLPDDPIVPMYEERVVFKSFKDLDIDQSTPENVTLVDDFINSILKENSDEFDNRQGNLETGNDLNKNKENDRNLYKNESSNKTQYSSLNNGFLLNMMYKNTDKPIKKFDVTQSGENIDKIVESFTEIEENAFTEDYLNYNNSKLIIDNQEISLSSTINGVSKHNFEADHSSIISKNSDLLLENHVKIQKKYSPKFKADVLKTYDKRHIKTNEKLEEIDKKADKSAENGSTTNVSKIKNLIKTTSNKEEVYEHCVEPPNKLNETMDNYYVKTNETYNKTSQGSSITSKISNTDKIKGNVEVQKNSEVKELGYEELNVSNNKIAETDDTVIDTRENENIQLQCSLPENHEKSERSEIHIETKENPVEATEIRVEIKAVLSSTEKTKANRKGNKTSETQEGLESRQKDLETPTQSTVKIENENKSDTKYKKLTLISYKYLEEIESCTSEDDVIPLSKLRTRMKTKVHVNLTNKKSVKKDKVNKKKLDKIDVPAENVLISSEKKFIPAHVDMGGKKIKNENVKSDKRTEESRKSASRKTKNTNTEFEVSVGQFMWAKVGSFPYWPCMLAEEPDSKKFIKDLNKRKLCHVRFFGDKGRRAWISKKQLLPYCSLAELQKYPNVSRSDVSPSRRVPRYKVNWQKAINEANSLKNKNLEDKLAFFENVLRLQDKEREEKKFKKATEFSKKRKLEVPKEENVEVISTKRVTRNSGNTTVELSPKRKKPNQDDSESEPESETSLQGFPSNIEEQIALYKRNNLFKKVTKERICQICLKLGAVSRCKGRCQGFYHIVCAEKNYIKEMINGIKVEVEDKIHLNIDRVDDLINNEIIMSTNEKQVEIISIKDRKRLTPTNLTLSNDIMFKSLPLLEQIDQKMTEVMRDFNDKTLYLESSTDGSLHESSVENTPEKPKTIKKNNEVFISNDKKIITELICKNCLENNDPLCFVCDKEISRNNSIVRQRCSWLKCGKFYHPECLKIWPQTQWSVTTSKKYKHHLNSNEFVCPMHVCHTCVSDDPRTPISRCYSDKLVKCVYCPSTYHTATYCVPAGTRILSSTQIVCPKHENVKQSSRKSRAPINTTWCFICSEGGALVCCETCPTSVHAECLDIKFTDDDKFICEDCETGRFPLYDEIVWVKLGTYRWWPAIILFPNEIPEKVRNRNHNPGEFVVKFFGTYDHYWISKGRVFLFQEGDNGGAGGTHKRKMEEIFKRSIDEATLVHLLKKEFKESILRETESKSKNRPPPYVKIKINRPVGNVRQFDGNVSNTTPCECDPKRKDPCGPDSDCLNRLLLTECDATVCPAGDKCQNQNFERRNYPDLIPHKTDERGWGLQSLEPLTKGRFVIEYVGEMIDEQEYQRRAKKMHELKEENYYFLTIDKDRMIDAGPKGNLARFMNHSCQPNCETQKWTVNGDTRVGLFALDDIPANTELTFNYNLECIDKEKKICKCGAPNCSGFIGVKVKQANELKTKVKARKYKKKRSPTPIVQELTEPCFVCGQGGDLRPCDNKICSNYYHSKCVGLENWPEGKWICPWHNCKICTKRTIRCCVKCLNSFCPKHSQGNIRYDKLLGFICSTHDLRKNNSPSVLNIKTEETEVTSTTADIQEELQLPMADLLDDSIKVGEVITSTPYKVDTTKSKKLSKRKRSSRLLDMQPVSKGARYEVHSLRKNASSHTSRTLRSATVNGSGDKTKLKLKA